MTTVFRQKATNNGDIYIHYSNSIRFDSSDYHIKTAKSNYIRVSIARYDTAGQMLVPISRFAELPNKMLENHQKRIQLVCYANKR